MAQCLRSFPVKFSSAGNVLVAKTLENINYSSNGLDFIIKNNSHNRRYLLDSTLTYDNKLPSLIPSSSKSLVVSPIQQPRNLYLVKNVHSQEALGNSFHAFYSTLKLKEEEPEKLHYQVKSSNEQKNSNKASAEQIQHVYNSLERTLPKLFTQTMDYSYYRVEMELVDNIRNKVFKGLSDFVMQVSLLRVYGHLKYAFVKFELLNMSQSVDEGRITVRWRITGLSGLRVMFKFWQFKLWKWKELMNQTETWHDGISHFYLGEDGKVFRVVVDKVMEDRETLKEDKKASILAKLALIVALFPKNGINCPTFSSVFMNMKNSQRKIKRSTEIV